MKIYLFIWLCFGFFFLKAQNLIPNPGFEERMRDGTPKYWLQPKGDYYHYELVRVDTAGKEERNYSHGLCTIMPLPSEYLCIKLKKDIIAGKTYHFKIKTYIKDESWNKIEQLGHFECAVLNHYENVTPLRTRIKAQPLFKFYVDSNPDRPRPYWQYYHLTFTAQTSGSYFYIGRFHSDFTYSLFDSLVSIKERFIAERDSNVIRVQDSISNVVPPFMADATKIKNVKKQKKLLQNFINQQNRSKNLAKFNLFNETNFKLDSVNKIYLDPYYFHVRIYYDDLCLAEVQSDQTCDCRDTMYEQKNKYELGKTYTLKNIKFELDKSVLLPQSFVELDNLVKIMTEYPKMTIKIMGHTDNQNSDAYNITLSKNRSLACVKYLIKKGINPKRLTWQGFGERKPIDTNLTEKGKANNRRVEFMVLSY